MANLLYTDELVAKNQVIEPNLLINGNFDYFQRSLGPVAFTTTLDYYGPDRWLNRRLGLSGSATVERDADTSTIGHFMLMKSLNTNSIYLNTYQRIEARYIEPLVGENLYWGVWVWQSSGGTIDVNMAAYTPNSTADNWSTDFLDLNYIGANTTSVPNGQWVWVDFSFTVPTDGKNGLMVGFQTDQFNAVSSWWLKNAVVHRGTKKLPDYLVHTRHPSEELALCQHYYSKSYNWNTNPGSTTNTGRKETIAGGPGFAPTSANFPVPMFISPTVTLYSSDGTAGNVNAKTIGNDPATVGYVGRTGFGYIASTGSNFTAGDWLDYHYTADAEI